MIRRWHFVGCLWLICLCSCHRGPGALASLSITQIVDRAKPATVLIVAEFEANGTIPSFTTDNARLAEDVRRQINPDDSDQQKIEKLFETFLAHPEQYLRQQGDGQRISTKIHVLGSGFVVTPDGYILTNAHVVKPDEEDLSKDVLNKISDQVDQDVKDVGEGIERLVPGETISDAGVTRLRTALLQQYVKNADLHFNREVGVALSTENMGTDLNLRHCTVVKVGEPTPGKDVAVLKIDGNNLPTLPMAEGVETGSVRTGSDLVIMGYPGKVDVDENFTLASRLQPSMSYGHVSGIKEMSSGWYVIQTDATINPGNSGGPALNQYGQVVGQATFAETESQGLNFAIDIDVAREFLRDLNIITGVHPTVKTALSSSTASSSSASSSSPERPRRFPLGMVFLLFVLVGVAIVIAIVVSRN